MITEVKDQLNLIPTSSYPHAIFPFTHFNPVQSRVYEQYGQDCNYLVSANMSSGKTVCAEMIMAHTVRNNSKKAMYLSPLKALAQEKVDTWKQSHFADLPIGIFTGDYRMTPSRQKEINEAKVVLATFEMLNSRVRNGQSESNAWLQDVGCLVLDEFHTIGSKGRGDHIETGLMKFTDINPSARIIGLSGTLANANELASWLSSLNGKKTYVLSSDYRPVPLDIHYVKYWHVQFGYDQNEREKVQEVVRLVESYPHDKVIVFVHTKKTGALLLETLKVRGISCEYHNADLTKEKRVDIERRFRESPALRCLIATSTVAQGLNMPARRVVVTGVHRGIEEVASEEIWQMAGRAGRPQYDKKGDVHILLPSKDFDKQKRRIQELQPVRSQLSEVKTIAFHLISEIHHKTIRNLDDVYSWYESSLAYHQNVELDESFVQEIIKKLKLCGAITEHDGNYEVTTVGTVSSMFYYSPLDVSDLNRNFTRLFEKNKEVNDYWLAMALGNTDSNIVGIVSNADRDEMEKFKKGLDETACQKAFVGTREFTDGAVKTGCCYYNLLRGYNSPMLGGVMRGLQMDSERLCEVLATLDNMTGKWDRKEFFKRLYLRLLYGVDEAMVDLCRLRGIGKIKAKRLWDANLRNLGDISSNTSGVIKALNCSKNVADEVCRNAKELLLVT